MNKLKENSVTCAQRLTPIRVPKLKLHRGYILNILQYEKQ